ncbi:hypothetical protein QOT17_005216 [Balamuthia mandrillaris]
MARNRFFSSAQLLFLLGVTLSLVRSSQGFGCDHKACQTVHSAVPEVFYYNFASDYLTWVQNTFGGATVLPEYVNQETTDPNLYFDEDPDAECFLNITFTYELAGYRNRMGYFVFKSEDIPDEVEEENDIPSSLKDSMRVVFNDASTTPSCLNQGATVSIGPFAGDQAIGFFLLPNDVCETNNPTRSSGKPRRPESAYWSIDIFNSHKVQSNWKTYPSTGRMVAVVKDPVRNRFHLGFEDYPSYDQDYNDLVFFLESSCRIDEEFIPCLDPNTQGQIQCPAGKVLNFELCACVCANQVGCPGVLQWNEEECSCSCPSAEESPCVSTRCITSVCQEGTGTCLETPVECEGEDTSCSHWVCDEEEGCIREELPCSQPSNKCVRRECNHQTWECEEENVDRPAWAVDDACSTYACNSNTGQWELTETSCPTDTACTTYSCDPEEGCVSTPVPCEDCPEGPSCAIWECHDTHGWRNRGAQDCPTPEDLCQEYLCDEDTTACVLTDKTTPSALAADQCNTYECNSETGEWDATPVSCPVDTACETYSCNSDEGCITTPVPCEDCPEGPSCAEWECHPQRGWEIVDEKDCPTPEDLCQEYHCDEDTSACVLFYKVIPAELEADQCNDYECNSETGEWEATPVSCPADTACETYSCDPVEGCISTPVPCEDCPQGPSCAQWECHWKHGWRNRGEKDCPTPEDLCQEYLCDEETTACILTDKTVPSGFAEDQCNSYECNSETGEWDATPVSCPADTACETFTCNPDEGCLSTLVPCEDCPEGPSCAIWECHPQRGWEIVEEKDCPTPEDLCTEFLCDEDTTACILSDKVIPAELEADQCNTYECNPETGEWEATPVSCPADTACKTYSCDPEEGCFSTPIPCEECPVGPSCAIWECHWKHGWRTQGKQDCPTPEDLCQEYLCDEDTTACILTDKTIPSALAADQCNDYECNSETGEWDATPVSCPVDTACETFSCVPDKGCLSTLVPCDDCPSEPACADWECHPQRGWEIIDEKDCPTPEDLCQEYLCDEDTTACILSDKVIPSELEADQCNTYECNSETGEWDATPVSCPADTACETFSCIREEGCVSTAVPCEDCPSEPACADWECHWKHGWRPSARKQCPTHEDLCKEYLCDSESTACVLYNKVIPAELEADQCNTYECNSETGEWDATPVSCPADTACETYSCIREEGCVSTAVPCEDCPSEPACAEWECHPVRGWQPVEEKGCPTPEDRCKEYLCDEETTACILSDKIIPAELEDDQCNTYECNSDTGEWDATPVSCPADTACETFSCDRDEGCLSTAIPCENCPSEPACANWECHPVRGWEAVDEKSCPIHDDLCKEYLCDDETTACVLSDKTIPDDLAADQCNTYECNSETGEWDATPVSCPEDTACETFSCHRDEGCLSTPVPCQDCPSEPACAEWECHPVRGWEPVEEKDCPIPDNLCKEYLCDAESTACMLSDKPIPEDLAADQCNTYQCRPNTGTWKATPITCPEDTPCKSYSCDSALGCQFTLKECPDCPEEPSCATFSCHDELGWQATSKDCPEEVPGDQCLEYQCTEDFQCVPQPKESPAGVRNDSCNTFRCNSQTGEWDNTPTQCPEDTSCRTFSCHPENGCVANLLKCAQPEDQCKEAICHGESFECVIQDKPIPDGIRNDSCNTFKCNSQTGEWDNTPTQCPSSDLCNHWSCDPDEGCINTETLCPEDTACGRWTCNPDTTKRYEGVNAGCVMSLTSCPAPVDKCKQNVCLEGACQEQDVPRPEDLAQDNLCEEFQCNPNTGAWQPQPIHQCDSLAAEGCAEWYCHSEEGCLLSVRAGCCGEFDNNCTSCVETLGCVYDLSEDMCEALDLPLEYSRALPNGTANWEDLISSCSGGGGGGSGGDGNTTVIVASVASAAGAGALGAGAAGLAAWRKLKKKNVPGTTASAMDAMALGSATVSPLFEAATTEQKNPLFEQ